MRTTLLAFTALFLAGGALAQSPPTAREPRVPQASMPRGEGPRPGRVEDQAYAGGGMVLENGRPVPLPGDRTPPPALSGTPPLSTR